MDAVPAETPTVDQQSAARRAVVAYRRRMRPWRITYAAVLVALAVAAGVVVKVAYIHGEISHATLRTASAPAPPVPLADPSARLTRAWSSPDRTAIGTPYDGGTVITYSTHAVVGRDGHTGKVRWSYTRTDRTTCTAAQLDGVTIAVFRLHGDCDELTGLDSGTGKRLWTRTLHENGHPVLGTPAFSVGSDTFMVTTPSVIYALSPDGTAAQNNGGLDRWLFAEAGCRINSAVLGTSGALISQTCRHPHCDGRKFCGTGPQLLLRDPILGADDDDKKNPDQIKWNLIGSTLRPVSADTVVSAAAPGGDTLSTFTADKGKHLASLPLLDPFAGHPQTTATATAELIRVGTYTYALDNSGTAYAWRAATAALPTSVGTGDVEPAPLADSRLSVPVPGGIGELDPASGKPARTFPVAPPAASSRVFPYGTGFLVTGPHTTVYR
jgi:hypothetical protein